MSQAIGRKLALRREIHGLVDDMNKAALPACEAHDGIATQLPSTHFAGLPRPFWGRLVFDVGARNLGLASNMGDVSDP